MCLIISYEIIFIKTASVKHSDVVEFWFCGYSGSTYNTTSNMCTMSCSKKFETLIIITMFSDTYNMPQQTASVTPVVSNDTTIWGKSKLHPELPSMSVYKHIAVLSRKPTGKTRIDNLPGLVPLNAVFGLASLGKPEISGKVFRLFYLSICLVKWQVVFAVCCKSQRFLPSESKPKTRIYAQSFVESWKYLFGVNLKIPRMSSGQCYGV